MTMQNEPLSTESRGYPMEKEIRFRRFISRLLTSPRSGRVCCEGRISRVFSASNKKVSTSKETVGVFGYGEVGQAVAKFFQQPKIKDLNRDDGLEGITVLHVCIPWNYRFHTTIKKAIKTIKPKLVIIHSTVAIGTTKRLNDELPEVFIAHSPIRGVHPHLYEGIKTFVKYIGADKEEAGTLAKNHLEPLGIKTKIVIPSATSELAKLLDTTYYGLCIAFHGEVKKMCDKLNLDFDKVMTDFNTTYNEGYAKLGKTNVIRPVLKAPEGDIGGHCIVSNTKILKQYFDSKVLDIILDYKLKEK